MTTLEQRRPDHPREPATVDPVTARWLPVQRGAAASILLASLFVQAVMARHVIPPLVVIMVAFGVAAALTWRRPRGATIAVGVLGLLALLLFLPDIVRDLSNPESAFTFVVTGVIAVAAAVAAVGGAMTIARRASVRAPSLVPGTAVMVVALLVIVAVGSRLTLESDVAEPGDLRVVAERTRYSPERLEATAGTIGIHVENRDLGHHDLVIEELGVELDVPERSSRRIELDAEPGSYQIVCTLPGHEQMTIDLTVS